jgi:Holliday junction resolvase RusA-like endonuclease
MNHDKMGPLLSELEPYTKLLGDPIREPVVMDCYINFHQTGATPFPVATVFGDEDNLRKAVNDCLVMKQILDDDRWVIGGETFKLFTPHNHYAQITIWKAALPSSSAGPLGL